MQGTKRTLVISVKVEVEVHSGTRLTDDEIVGHLRRNVDSAAQGLWPHAKTLSSTVKLAGKGGKVKS